MTIGLPFLPFEVSIRRKPTAAVRFRIRDAMIAVAVVAVLLGLGIHVSGLKDRARRFSSLANDYTNRSFQTSWLARETAQSARQARDAVAEAERLAGECRGRGDSDGEARHRLAAEDRRTTIRALDESAVNLGRKASWLMDRAMKYRTATDRPIWPVWPDPAD